MTPREPIDSLIDNTASRLTSATPSDALRANVMSRIASERRPRFVWRYVFAGGALASIALVMFVTWPRNPAVPNPAIPTATIPTPTLLNPTVINGTASVNPTGVRTQTSPLASVVRTAAAHDSGHAAFASAAGTEQDWSSERVAALERPELIAPVKPLLEVAPFKTIDVEPIRVAPLVVRAIDDDNQ
jgi:hypothetical protein